MQQGAPTAQIPTAIGHQIPRAGETEIPDDRKAVGGGNPETSRRCDDLNQAGCGARNIARRSLSARNPLRARLHLREAATPEPRTQKPAWKGGSALPAITGETLPWQAELP